MKKRKTYSCGRRYCIFAKRKNATEWSVWTDANTLKVAKEHLERVRELGFLGNITDRRKQKIIISD